MFTAGRERGPPSSIFAATSLVGARRHAQGRGAQLFHTSTEDEIADLHDRIQKAWEAAPPSTWNVLELRLVCLILEGIVPHVLRRQKRISLRGQLGVDVRPSDEVDTVRHLRAV